MKKNDAYLYFLVSLGVATVFFLGNEAVNCDGVFVRTFFWFECIKG